MTARAQLSLIQVAKAKGAKQRGMSVEAFIVEIEVKDWAYAFWMSIWELRMTVESALYKILWLSSCPVIKADIRQNFSPRL
jgi:hypothetical protein